MLKRRLADIDAERPSLGALYAALTPEQKQSFGHAGMGGPMRMGMMGGRHPGMGPDMGRGPMGPVVHCPLHCRRPLAVRLRAAVAEASARGPPAWHTRTSFGPQG